MGWRPHRNRATIELEVWWRGFSRDWATFEIFESLVAEPTSKSKVRAFLKAELQKKDNSDLREKLEQLEAAGAGAGDSQKPQGPFKRRVQSSPSGDAAVLGAQVKVYWPAMRRWYKGMITHVDPEDLALTVTYADGDELTYPPDFKGYKWKLVTD